MFLSIAFNNWIAGFSSAFSGIIAFSPLGVIFLNGYIVGLTVGIFQEIYSVNPVLSLIPHGVIEIPVFMATCLQGLRISYHILKHFRDDELPRILDALLREALYICVGTLIPFMLAAAIESSISPIVLRKIIGG